jgi:uncharacterized protein YndB with AHSA1/START domain
MTCEQQVGAWRTQPNVRDDGVSGTDFPLQIRAELPCVEVQRGIDIRTRDIDEIESFEHIYSLGNGRWANYRRLFQMSKGIHQEMTIDASPDRVYKALTDAGQFSTMSGAPATIVKDAGGAFTAFGGMVVGRTIELVPNKRIVQAWRVANWPEGLYSIVRFELDRNGTGTSLVLDQCGFPDDERDHLDAGWNKMYWEPLRKHISS